MSYVHVKMLTAIHQGDVSTVRELLSQGFEINAPLPPPQEGLILSHAARAGVQPIVELLLAAGAAVSEVDGGGVPPLFAALRHASIAHLLLERGASPHVRAMQGRTPLHYAVLCGGHSIGVLIEHDAEIEAADDEGATALHLACQSALARSAKLLVAAGANVHARDRTGKTSLMAAVSGNEKSRLAIVEQLLQSGAALDAVSDSQQTAFLYACTHGATLDLVKLLVERGADPRVTTSVGQNGWELARCYKRVHLEPLLRQLGLEAPSQ